MVRWGSCSMHIFAAALALVLLAGKSGGSRPLAVFEAEILIYLTENGDYNRQKGQDIAWTSQPCVDVPNQDFYCFWLVGTPPPPEGGSVTIGPYAVDRHSGEVWDLALKRPDRSVEVSKVQDLMRRGHRIDQELVRRREQETRRILLE